MHQLKKPKRLCFMFCIFFVFFYRGYFIIFLLCCIGTGLVCPPDWEHHDNSCYYFSNDTLPWDGAQEYCQEFGGYLAELTTTDENNYIEQMSTHYYHPNSTAQGDYIYGYWTGGVKNRTDGNWYWNDSGQKITLFNWAFPEPNDLAGKENCIHINSNEGFKWNDYVCTQNEYFICEKRQARYCPEVIG